MHPPRKESNGRLADELCLSRERPDQMNGSTRQDTADDAVNHDAADDEHGLTRRNKPRQGVVANTLKLHRNGAVGFIDWLDAAEMASPVLV